MHLLKINPKHALDVPQHCVLSHYRLTRRELIDLLFHRVQLILFAPKLLLAPFALAIQFFDFGLKLRLANLKPLQFMRIVHRFPFSLPPNPRINSDSHQRRSPLLPAGYAERSASLVACSNFIRHAAASVGLALALAHAAAAGLRCIPAREELLPHCSVQVL